MEFKERLKQLRKEYNYTQAKLSEKLGYGSSTISNYESGKNQPSIKDLIKLAKVFNVSLDYLLCHTDSRVPYFTVFESSELKELVKIYNLLSEESAAHVLSYCQFRLTWDTKQKEKEKNGIY